MPTSNTNIKETATELTTDLTLESPTNSSTGSLLNISSSISSIPYSVPTSILPYPSPTTFLQSIANLQAIYKYCMEEINTRNEEQQEIHKEIHNKQM